MNWRMALILGVFFVAVGIVYWFVQGIKTIDLAGVTMLIVLGAAMAFGFTILLRGSRDL